MVTCHAPLGVITQQSGGGGGGGGGGRTSGPVPAQNETKKKNTSTPAAVGLRLSSAATSSMPNAFVSIVLVKLCAAAYMHFFQPTVFTSLSPAPQPSAPSPTPPSAHASSPEPPTSTTPQETPTSSLSAEARRVQSIIDQRVKEAGGPKYVIKLDLVSASASNMNPENQR
jgi:hypothetical protein